MAGLCKGIADLWNAWYRRIAFSEKTAIAITPATHRRNREIPRAEGVSLLASMVKSSIQPAPLGLEIPEPAGSAASRPMPAGWENFGNHEKRGREPRGSSGKNGTAKSPSGRNHNWYCIRLDKLFFSNRFAANSVPIMMLIKILHRKNWYMKRSMSCAPFLNSLAYQKVSVKYPNPPTLKTGLNAPLP